jgi:hypothetical protein
MTTITATAGGDAAEIQLTIKPTADVLTVYRTDANGTHPVRTRAGVLPYALTGTEKRRNYCFNPSVASAAGYNATGDCPGAVVGGGWKATWTKASTAGSQGINSLNTLNPLSAAVGDQFTASTYVTSSRNNVINFGCYLRDSTGATVAGTNNGVYVALLAGQSTRLSATTLPAPVAVPGGCLYFYCYLSTSNGGTLGVVGDSLLVDGTQVEKSPIVTGYFSGGTPATATTGYKWLGNENASQSVEIDGSLLVLDDYEPAAGIVNYVVQDSKGAIITEASVSTSFDMDSPWLSVPTMQTLSRPVESVLTYDATRDTRSTIIDIPGRPDPVVVLRVMSTRRGSVEIFTGTHAEAAAIISLCDRGEVLMLRQPDHMGMDMYFTALSADIRVLQTSGKRTVFSVVLRYVETRFPAGALLNEPGWDFTGLAAENTSFTALSNRYRDFQAAALHKSIGGV